MTTLPTFTIRELMDSGAHFGHKTLRWNPKMAPYIYGIRNGIHIIDLQQTAPMLYDALKTIHDVVQKNGRVLFVGTKYQAQQPIAEAAQRCGQYYINYRWLGGTLTNWNTVSASIKTLKKLEAQLADETLVFTKKEKLQQAREKEKLERSLGGIKNMPGLPDILFIIDTNKEDLAIKEAQKLGIPTVAIVDTNSDPDGITYPIPANDDAARAIKLYCELVSEAVLAGIQDELTASGADIGESETAPGEVTAEVSEESLKKKAGKK